MINFLKNIFGSLASSKSRANSSQTEDLAAAAVLATLSDEDLYKYTGPKEFANKPAVDYLLSSTYGVKPAFIELILVPNSNFHNSLRIVSSTPANLEPQYQPR